MAYNLINLRPPMEPWKCGQAAGDLITEALKHRKSHTGMKMWSYDEGGLKIKGCKIEWPEYCTPLVIYMSVIMIQ